MKRFIYGFIICSLLLISCKQDTIEVPASEKAQTEVNDDNTSEPQTVLPDINDKSYLQKQKTCPNRESKMSQNGFWRVPGEIQDLLRQLLASWRPLGGPLEATWAKKK